MYKALRQISYHQSRGTGEVFLAIGIGLSGIDGRSSLSLLKKQPESWEVLVIVDGVRRDYMLE